MPRPKIGNERREDILQAFERCVVRKGLPSTTLSDVAEEAGHPRSLIRYFIGNRNDMVSKLIDRMLERGRSQLDLLQSTSGISGTKQLETFLIEEVFSDERDNKIMLELWHLAIRDDNIRKRLAETYQLIIEEVADKLALDSAAAEPSQFIPIANAVVSSALGQSVLRQLGVR